MVTLVNRAKMTTATTGTGTITLGTAEAGYQSFADAGVVDTDVVRYVIEDGTAWEIGTGTYSAGTLTRTVAESSNADAALNLTGSAVVYVSATAADIPPVLELYAENYVSGTLPIATGEDAFVIGRNSTSSGQRSVALGAYSTASGTFSVAVSGSVASGTNSVGILGSATQNGATAIGSNSTLKAAQAVGQGAMALGGSRASGTDSFAAAITTNSATYGATGANSVAIGYLAKASNTDAVAIGGEQSFASGGNSFAAGGEFQTASGAMAVALGGSVNTASGEASYAYGKRSLADKVGKYAYGAQLVGTSGVTQSGMMVLIAATADVTPNILRSNTNAATTINQVILPNNSAYAFHGTIVARQQASQGTACAAWKIEGLIRREGSAGTTVLVNSATTVLDNTPAWGMALSADTTNGGLKIEVTGAAATNIRWVATINTSEVTY